MSSEPEDWLPPHSHGWQRVDRAAFESERGLQLGTLN
jgi:hypothetical protein